MSSSNHKTPLLNHAVKTRPNTQQGDPRRMGVEIEFAGLESKQIVEPIQDQLGGEIEWRSPFDILINDTELGQFKVELDSSSVKKLGEDSEIAGDIDEAEPGMQRSYMEAVSSVASAVVPWEVVSPPIEFASLQKLYPLVSKYRELGAKGTRNQLHYAFGVHLNPELVDLEANTIVRHLKSFFCLYEWIKDTEKTDPTRRLTPYINHFDKNYVELVLAADYQPDTQQLIDDYLTHNPTRNRSLDMLPLFAHLDESTVRAAVDDARVNARPTFHYRLANCDIDNPDWNLDIAIENWMAVEHLAYHDDLQDICDEYLVELDRLIPNLSSEWSDKMQSRLSESIRRVL